jgi:hypothetical protein
LCAPLHAVGETFPRPFRGINNRKNALFPTNAIPGGCGNASGT